MNQSARFNVLVTNGNQALANNLDTINVGQLGFFSALTNSTAVANCKKEGFYAITKTTDLKNPYRKSLLEIKPADVVAFSVKQATAFQPAIKIFKCTTVGFDTEYLIKIEISGIQYYVTDHYNPATKLIAYRTEPCNLPNCTYPDYFKMISFIIDSINSDPRFNTFIYAEPANPTNNTPIPLANLQTWINNNPGVFPAIRFTINKPTIDVTNTLYKYYNPREVEVNIFGEAGFEFNYTVTTLQPMIYEQVSGVEVQELERIAGGWDGNPGVYRTLTDMPKDIFYSANPNTLYSLFTIHYRPKSQSGLLNYINDLSLIIAVPSTDNITFNAILSFLTNALS